MKPKPTSKPPTSKPPTSKPPTPKPPTFKPPTFKPIETCLFDRTDCLFEWIMLGVGIFIIFIPLLRYIFINRFEHLSV